MGVHWVVAGALLLAAAAAAAAAPNQLPQSWPRCRRRDTNFDICLQHAVQVVIPQLAGGVPELNLPPLEPIFTNDSFTLARKPGRIDLDIKMSNLYSHGISTMKVISVYSDLDNGVIDMHLTLPITVMHADMEVEGSVLHEPVNPQNGSINMTFYDLSGMLVVSGDIVERDGDSYLDVNYAKGTVLSISGLDVQIHPLDKSAKRSSKLNYLLNSNVLALWPDLRNILEKKHSEGFVQLASAVFSKVPLKEIFLADDHPTVLAGPSSVLLFGR